MIEKRIVLVHDHKDNVIPSLLSFISIERAKEFVRSEVDEHGIDYFDNAPMEEYQIHEITEETRLAHRFSYDPESETFVEIEK